MSEDWKGEHFIRNSGQRTNKREEATRMSNIIHHAKRRKAGIPAPGAIKHSRLAVLAFRDKQRGDVQSDGRR